MPLTILQPVGYDAHSCGYCSPAGERSKKHGSRSFGCELLGGVEVQWVLGLATPL